MEIDIENLHHAYLIESAPQSGERFLVNLFEKLGFNSLGNPDFYAFESDSFLVDDARLLNIRAQNKAFGERKIFVIKNSKLNREAQNALLKTLEEPTENTHFFILLPERDLLLPTLLSRLQIIRLHEEGEKNLEAEKFLALPPKDRLDFAKKFADKEKPLAPFLDAILLELKNKNAGKGEVEKVFTLRKFADDPAASTRLILEHLALVLK